MPIAPRRGLYPPAAPPAPPALGSPTSRQNGQMSPANIDRTNRGIDWDRDRPNSDPDYLPDFHYDQEGNRPSLRGPPPAPPPGSHYGGPGQPGNVGPQTRNKAALPTPPPGAILLGDPRLYPGPGQEQNLYKQFAADGTPYWLPKPTWGLPDTPDDPTKMGTNAWWAAEAAKYYGKPASKELTQQFRWSIGDPSATMGGQAPWSVQAQTGGWRPIDFYNDSRISKEFKDRMLDVNARKLSRAEMERQRASGTARIKYGTPGATLDQQAGPPLTDYYDDVQAAYRKKWEDQFADKKWYTDKQGWGSDIFGTAPTGSTQSAGTTRAPGAKKKAMQDLAGLTAEQKANLGKLKAAGFKGGAAGNAELVDQAQTEAGKQLKGQTGEAGKIIKIGGRTYRLNKNGSWVDWTDPKNRERVTTKGAKSELVGRKKPPKK